MGTKGISSIWAASRQAPLVELYRLPTALSNYVITKQGLRCLITMSMVGQLPVLLMRCRRLPARLKLGVDNLFFFSSFF